MRDYVRDAMRHPQLLGLAPSTLIRNAEGVVDHFRPQGLTLRSYLLAVRTNLSLLTQVPATIIANVESAASHFREHGLNLHDYLRAVVKQPCLFYQSPATIIANIEQVACHFRDHGLTLPDYLSAACRYPALFAQAPATIIHHVKLIIELNRQGLVTFPGQEKAPPGRPLAPLFAFLVRNPIYFSLADDNFALRALYVHITGDRPSGTALLKRPRYRIEQDLARALGVSVSDVQHLARQAALQAAPGTATPKPPRSPGKRSKR